MRRLASELFKNLAGLARELSDESAYRRHLSARGVAHSAEEWRRFQNKRLRERYLQAKCC